MTHTKTPWRSDMENAPRDGEIIHLRCKGAVYVGFWLPGTKIRPDANDELFPWRIIDTDQRDGWNALRDGQHGPDAWQPLKPPQ